MSSSLFTDYGKKPYQMPFKDGLLDLLFPQVCKGCGNKAFDAPIPLCVFCISHIEKARENQIQSHLEIFGRSALPFTHLFSLWLFDKTGVVQRLHHALKYQNRPAYGIELGKMMTPSLLSIFDEINPPDVLVPIPLHRKRYLERGYNQSEMLARGIHLETGIPVDTSNLIRTKTTRTQTGLGRDDRWNNVDRAFRFSTTNTGYSHALLIDDVLTTGATLLSAADCLKDAGLAKVSLATLAFTRP